MANVTERETVTALLRLEEGLQRVLLQPPATRAEQAAWRDTITSLLLESACGRLFLSRLRAARIAAEQGHEERLAG